MEKETRFKVIHREGSEFSSSGRKHILVDTETGVNYLWIATGYSGGLTPLLDAQGNPIVTK